MNCRMCSKCFSLPENIENLDSPQLRREGHSEAGWGIGGSVYLQTAGSKVRLLGQWAATTCAALPTANAGKYATSHCKLLLF